VLQILTDEPFIGVLKKRLLSVETQLQSVMEEVNAKMPKGIVSYQNLEADIKTVDREIRMAEFIYGMSLGKAFDANQADLHLKMNQNAFVNRMKDMHAGRLALARQKKKADDKKDDSAGEEGEG
jgi:hypothetical protein